MALFRKDLVQPGKYRLLDGSVAEFTEMDCAQMRRNLEEMLAAGLHVPVAWGHQDVVPMASGDRLAQDIKNVCGWVQAPYGGDVRQPGLEGLLNVPLDEDARRMEAVRFVSPEVQRNWTDSTGRTWPGLSITHVAITARPVNHHQRPLVPVAESGPRRLSQDRVWLSNDPAEGGPMPDDYDDKKGDKDSKGDKDGNGKTGELSALIDALREAGHNVPDEVGSISELIIAVKAGGQSSESTPDEPVDDMGDDEGGPSPIEEDSSLPIAMSLDPTRNPLAAKIVREGRARLVERAGKLATEGKLAKPAADALAGKLQTARLSLDGRGRLMGGKAVAVLKAYEALPARRFGNASASRLSEDPLPSFDPRKRGQADDEEMRRLAKERAAAVSVTSTNHKEG